jgi:hypothetical protein
MFLSVLYNKSGRMAFGGLREGFLRGCDGIVKECNEQSGPYVGFGCEFHEVLRRIL